MSHLPPCTPTHLEVLLSFETLLCSGHRGVEGVRGVEGTRSGGTRGEASRVQSPLPTTTFLTGFSYETINFGKSNKHLSIPN